MGGTDYIVRDLDCKAMSPSQQMFAAYFTKAPTDQDNHPAVTTTSSGVDSNSTCARATVETSVVTEGIINSIELCIELCSAVAVCQAFEAAGIEVPDVDPVGSKKYVDHRSRVVWNISLALVKFRASFPVALSTFSLCMHMEI